MPTHFQFCLIFLCNIIPSILSKQQSAPPSLELFILYGKFGIKTNLLEPHNELILTSINFNYPFNVIKLNSIHHPNPFNFTKISLQNNTTIPVSHHNSFIELKSASNIALPFSFYNSETSTAVYQQEPPGISFAYTFTDLSHSITHQLYNNRLIQHRLFSLCPLTNYIGEMFFGNTPHNHIQHKQRGRCKISSTSNWECLLNSVNIFNSSTSSTQYYQVNNNIVFNPTQGFIYVPYAFISYLLHTLFKHQFEHKKCWIEDETQPKGIVCSYYVYRENVFGNTTLSFVIGGYRYTTYVKDMFMIFEDYLKFIIVESPYDNTWELGGFFLQNFVSEYNYDTNWISLYSLNRNYKITTDYVGATRILLTMNIMLLAAGAVFCLFSKHTYLHHI